MRIGSNSVNPLGRYTPESLLRRVQACEREYFVDVVLRIVIGRIKLT
jgi:hypothetical protein